MKYSLITYNVCKKSFWCTSQRGKKLDRIPLASTLRVNSLILFQEKIEVVNAQAQLFAEADHFDAPTISLKKEVLNARYQQLQVKKKNNNNSNIAGGEWKIFYYH